MQKRPSASENFIDNKREPEKYPIAFQNKRDGSLLLRIYQHDFLTYDQVKRLFFPHQTDRVIKARLSKLFHNNYLCRTNSKGASAIGSVIYWLGPQGLNWIAGKLHCRLSDLDYRETPAFSQAEHDSWVCEFSLLIEEAVASDPQLTLTEWVKERTFRGWHDKVDYTSLNGKKGRREFYPDSFYRVERVSEGKPYGARLMLEILRTYHSVEQFVDKKVLPGLAYLRSPIYQKRFCKVGEEAGGRFLVVVMSDRIRDSLRNRTLKAVGRDARVWYFATIEEVNAQTILHQPIWWPGHGDEPVPIFKP